MAITNEMHKSNPASDRHALLVRELRLGKYINAHSATSGKKGSPASANDQSQTLLQIKGQFYSLTKE